MPQVTQQLDNLAMGIVQALQGVAKAILQGLQTVLAVDGLKQSIGLPTAEKVDAIPAVFLSGQAQLFGAIAAVLPGLRDGKG